MSTIPVIKRGDAVTLPLETLVNLAGAGYTGGQVFLRSTGTPAVAITKTIAVPAAPATAVSLALTSADTAVVGNYTVELEMTPGPHTYPTDGYAHLEIVADLG